VRSYRTFSPLPRRRRSGFVLLSKGRKWACRANRLRCCETNKSRDWYASLQSLHNDAAAVCFLWHFPSNGLEPILPDVIRHPALWSSDFPLPAPKSAESDRPVQLPTINIINPIPLTTFCDVFERPLVHS
jgi:hypothetical protein